MHFAYGLNKERYLKAYIEDKVSLSNDGPQKIVKELGIKSSVEAECHPVTGEHKISLTKSIDYVTVEDYKFNKTENAKRIKSIACNFPEVIFDCKGNCICFG